MDVFGRFVGAPAMTSFFFCCALACAVIAAVLLKGVYR